MGGLGDRYVMASRTISGNFDARQIARAIMSKEAGGYRFAGSELLQDDGDMQNKVTFSLHRDRRYTLDCAVLLADEPAPADHELEWTGPLFVAGAKRQVKLYRKKP